MQAIEFDPKASFAQNRAAFIARAAESDSELAEILDRHLDFLLEGGEEAARRRSRNTFNSRVEADLNKLLDGHSK